MDLEFPLVEKYGLRELVSTSLLLRGTSKAKCAKCRIQRLTLKIVKGDLRSILELSWASPVSWTPKQVAS